MKLKIALAVALALALAGCQKGYQKERFDESAVKGEASPAAADAMAASEAPAPGVADKPKSPPQPNGGAAMLAYAYSEDIETPAGKVVAVLRKQEQACAAAGPAQCQVLGERLSSIGRDDVEGRLDIRAEPHWLERYRASLETDARDAGGRVVGTGVETEDLTHSIVDTEAALRSKKALRDRLEALLQKPSNGIKDLLATEQELARVQGEIDSAESELAVMRERVQMSKLTISYRSASSLAPDSAFAPLRGATHSFLRNLMLSIGALITLLAFVAPFVPILWLAVWLWRRNRKRRAADRATSGG